MYQLRDQLSPGFFCEKIPGGNSWTLVSILGDFLNILENKYGPRDKSWTILGIEFHDSESPSIWYPFDKMVAISLANTALNNTNQAIFQLAHEAVHLLSPNGQRHALVIEEGLATLFSEEVSYHQQLNICTPEGMYSAAAALTKELLDYDPNVIKSIREDHPNISCFTPELIRSKAPDFPIDLATSLCEPFSLYV